MSNKKINAEQGHWLLAKMGKKVLRPGGKELTMALMREMDITPRDHVVEFAPGMGFTANIALANHPESYKGVELNEEAASLLRTKINGPGREIIIGNAADTGLPEESATKVYGEAMLTMQADHRKSEIVREARRVLSKGGLYGIHELGLTPGNLSPELKKEIQRELAKVIRVNARPLTVPEWTEIMEEEGFRIRKVVTNQMLLLEKHRILSDEGWLRTLKITWNIMTHPRARKQIRAMRSVFRKYMTHMNAVAIIAEKI